MNKLGFLPREQVRQIMESNLITSSVGSLVSVCHGDAKRAGWWTDLVTGEDLTETGNFNVPEKLMLCVSELSEGMEGHRRGLMDDHLPHRPMLEAELADNLIRVCDLAGALWLDLAGAVAEKLAFNRERADHKMENRLKEGGKKF